MTDKAIFAAGCFWGIEEKFNSTKGVVETEVGYIGGKTSSPNYEDVCSGNTQHAEAVRVFYDKDIISYDSLLDLFFEIHDPTTLNRQGNDIGTQYRSGIYFTEIKQKEITLKVIEQLEKEKIFKNTIITEVKKATTFYKAEEEHLNYFNQNPNQPYCNLLIKPKITKLKKYFSNNIIES